MRASLLSRSSLYCYLLRALRRRRRRRRRLAGVERGSRVTHVALDPRSGRVRATEHATRDPFRVLERRHGFAEIVERGAVVSRVRRARLDGLTGARLVERENLLVDFRNWEKAVKRFFSALKGSNALDRTVLCKDPEGVIEKILEGKTFDLDEVEVMRNRNLKVWKPAPEELDLAWAASRLHLAEKESLAAENERLRARVKELEASQ